MQTTWHMPCVYHWTHPWNHSKCVARHFKISTTQKLTQTFVSAIATTAITTPPVYIHRRRQSQHPKALYHKSILAATTTLNAPRDVFFILVASRMARIHMHYSVSPGMLCVYICVTKRCQTIARGCDQSHSTAADKTARFPKIKSRQLNVWSTHIILSPWAKLSNKKICRLGA